MKAGSACRLMPAVWNNGRKLTVRSARGEAGRRCTIDVVGERHAEGLDHGLGPAGGARRVEQIPDAVRGPGGVAARYGPALCRAGSSYAAKVMRRTPVLAARVSASGAVAHHAVACARHSRRGRDQLGRGLAPVERHQDGADLAAGEEQLEKNACSCGRARRGDQPCASPSASRRPAPRSARALNSAKVSLTSVSHS